MSIDTNRFSNKFYWQLKVVLSTCNYQATDYKTLIALFKVTSRRLCPGVPVHRGNNHCTPFFTNLCLSVEHCWFFFIGSCEPVHEDRTVPALYAGRIWKRSFASTVSPALHNNNLKTLAFHFSPTLVSVYWIHMFFSKESRKQCE